MIPPTPGGGTSARRGNSVSHPADDLTRTLARATAAGVAETVCEVVLAPGGEFVDCNEGMERLTGYRRAELLGRDLGVLSPVHLREAVRELWALVTADVIQALAGEPVTVVASNGEIRHAHIREIVERRDGARVVRLVPSTQSTHEPLEGPRELLAGWRVARRDLATLSPNDPRGAEIERAAEDRRDRYVQAVADRLRNLPERNASAHASAEGRYLRPSRELLSLLGRSRGDIDGALIGSLGRPGTEVAAHAAFMNFVASGEPVCISQDTLVLGDNTDALFRVTTVLDLDRPTTYRCQFERLGVPLPTSPRTAATVLAEWRRAEAELLTADDRHRYGVLTQIACLRAEYHAYVRRMTGQTDGDEHV